MITLRRSRYCRALSALPMALLAACGGGGSGDDGGVSNAPAPTPAPAPATVQSGAFKDANVAGLSFSSGGEAGVTDADGRFTCESGAAVEFSIGAVILGSTTCASLVTPLDFTASGALDDPEALGLARFLQMLDFDGDPSNGILISEAVQEVAAGWPQPDFSAADLEAELAGIISDAFSVDQTDHDLPTADAALAHLTASVQCALGGAFGGRMDGDLTGAIAIQVGPASFPRSPGVPHSVGWDGYDAIEEFVAGGGGANSVTYAALPVIDHSGPNLAGPLSGEYDSPDRISGTWSQPSFGLTGTYTVDRLGDDTADFRFTGGFRDPESGGAFSLGLTGATVSGEAFDVVTGETYVLTGALSGDQMTIDASNGASSFSATAEVGRDPDGSPIWLDGQLDGVPNSFVQASACRLN